MMKPVDQMTDCDLFLLLAEESFEDGIEVEQEQFCCPTIDQFREVGEVVLDKHGNILLT